jgi:hypothetical protein
VRSNAYSNGVTSIHAIAFTMDISEHLSDLSMIATSSLMVAVAQSRRIVIYESDRPVLCITSEPIKSLCPRALQDKSAEVCRKLKRGSVLAYVGSILL